MQEFDLFQCPLKGSNLIEAGAGTGKTYVITRLFLRLVVEERMPVNEILVVTFTEAATQELKSRTLEILRQALQELKNPSSPDASLKEYLDRIGSGETARLLNDAIRSFDEAAIFTIHGFCRRALSENAFESGSLFDTEITDDQEGLVEEIVEDFWRKKIYGATPELACHALDNKFTPENLKKSIGRHIEHPDMNIVPKPETWPCSPDAFRSVLKKVREAWPGAQAEIENILLTANLNRKTYRKQDIPGLLKKMELFSTSTASNPSLFEGFEKYTASKLTASMNKGQAAPAHPFFALCEDLKNEAGTLTEALDNHLLCLKYELFYYAEKELRRKKREKNLRSFGDLLTDLRNPLKDKARGPVLADTLRARFKAALIDEFQDTDPVQWDIFKTVFHGRESVLFLIGDPKQAIYGFRGADVHAYLEAASKVSQAYTLGKNYRSEPGLVEAVNAVFSRTGNPFVYEGIQFRPALAAEETGKSALAILGRREPPLHIWFLDRDGEADPAKSMNKAKARDRIAAAVAAEAARLIALGEKGDAAIGERRLEPRDIAVLTRTHKEARLSQEVLKSLRIPSVLESAGNLFDSPEAGEVQRVLAAVMEPGNIGLVKAALATDLLGVRGEDLEKLAEDAGEWSAALFRFREYNETWNRYGFIRMFRAFMAREGVRRRLLKFPDGERRVTNLLHVSEVLHQKSLEKCLSMNGTLAWLRGQMDPDHPAREKEHELRLESDENAVRIVTIHKSKGLEYPIVFCPFLWSGSSLRREDRSNGFLFHDEAGRLTLAIGPEEREAHKADAEKELLAENLRLCYVALTRAKHRCYVAWGGINSAETSALAYLFHNRNAPDEFLNQGAVRSMPDVELMNGLNQLAEEGKGSIGVSILSVEAGMVPEIYKTGTASLICRTFRGKVEEAWKISSFSSLVFNKPVLADLPDWDAPHGMEAADKTEPMDARPSIFTFPRGAKAGTALHAIFEEIDFTKEDPSSVVESNLARYGFGSEWTAPVCRMVRHVLETPLDRRGGNLKLSGISQKERVNEMEFHFPLSPVSPRELKGIFQKHGQANVEDGFPRRIGRLDFAPARGFMKGFMDLVFQSGGRYYLADWKSNYLGARVEDYGQDALRRAMEEGYYILQYHIYAVALDRYLALRVPGYDYETHFGGVYYIFLRGVGSDRGPEFGIFRDLPAVDLVRGLGRGLGLV
ncbi:MAG: exodeoxyribonuclease V subunit beta [Nitrospinae bacterium]|nr:exodeoxyribonuclease V subunit beta [Nitrospinota bacterium]